MSTPSDPSTVRCRYCNQPGPEYEYHHGDYCSMECYYRHRGERIINQIDSEHTICSTCYGKVKDTAPAKPLPVRAPDHPGALPGPRNVADGFQFKTQQTTHGVDEFPGGRPDGAAAVADRIERTRWSCQCGAVDPQDRHAVLQNVDLAETLANFYAALEWLHVREAIPHPPDREQYFAALREHWRDAAYAAGRAVYHDRETKV